MSGYVLGGRFHGSCAASERGYVHVGGRVCDESRGAVLDRN